MDPKTPDGKELSSMTVKDLNTALKERGVGGIARMRKAVSWGPLYSLFTLTN